jgi:(4S)-4-hydroxy-5-phosphonooxypentane-2,3-dione isomerase
MLIVHVHARVKPGRVEAFCAASVENARASVQEPGVARFDVVQNLDDPCHFTLVEVYRTAEDPARHKETTHYKTWAAVVEPMMVEPRWRVRYQNAFPDDEGWG